MTKKQFNVELPGALAKRVKKDAIEMNVSLVDYSRQAFEAFLGKPIASRRIHFDSRKKLTGRRIDLN